MNIKKSMLLRLLAVILVAALACPVSVAAMEPRASDYLSTYTAYVYPAGWGKIQVWFSIDGIADMDEIGALEIQLYESKDNETWTWLKTYQHHEYDGMLGYNNHYHDGYVEYNGVLGRYYKAYICIWAGKDGDGDTRYFWTPSQKATLFAG